MGQTAIIEECFDRFNSETGEINEQRRRTVHKSKIEPTDEFIKVSKYLNTIYAFNGIPLSLVPISLLIAQEMEWKTNIIYLLKGKKEEFAKMLDIKLDRVNRLISMCKEYDIIRPIERGVYEVNSYLFSTGSIAETRELQAHFDFDNEIFATTAKQKNRLTGETIRKSIINRKDKKLKDIIPGQQMLADFSNESE